jgi:hypothetical protein
MCPDYVMSTRSNMEMQPSAAIAPRTDARPIFEGTLLQGYKQ